MLQEWGLIICPIGDNEEGGSRSLAMSAEEHVEGNASMYNGHKIRPFVFTFR